MQQYKRRSHIIAIEYFASELFLAVPHLRRSKIFNTFTQGLRAWARLFRPNGAGAVLIAAFF